MSPLPGTIRSCRKQSDQQHSLGHVMKREIYRLRLQGTGVTTKWSDNVDKFVRASLRSLGIEFSSNSNVVTHLAPDVEELMVRSG